MEKKYRVLMIGDNASQLATLQKQLSEEPDCGHIEITASVQLTQADKHLKAPNVDAVILDFGMEVKPCLDAISRICAAVPAMPLVLVTDRDDENFIHDALKIGMDDCLIFSKLNGYELARSVTHAIQNKKVTSALTRERTLLRTLIDNMPDLIYVKDQESRFMLVSRSLAKFVGASDASELIGKTDFDFYLRDIATQYHADDQKVVNTGESIVDRQEPVIDRSGKQLWYSTTKVPLTDDTGKVIGILGISRDITERRQSQEMLRELFDHAPVGYHQIDKEGRIVHVNKTEADMLGFKADEMVGKPVWEFVQDVASSRTATLAKLSGKAPSGHAFERTLKCKDGRLLSVLIEDRVLQDKDGNICGIRSTLQDVSDRKFAEESLRESETRFRQLFDEAPVGYHEINTDGCVVRVNATELEMLGYTAEEMVGRPIWEFVEEDVSHKAVLAKLSGAIPPGRAFERTFRRKNGTTVPVLVEDHLLRNKEGYIVGIRSTIEDITDRKRADEELRLLSLTDPRTGLSNRRAFLALGGHQFKIAERNQRSITLIYCDIEGLRNINEEHGFQEGDKALMETAELLKKTFRSSDILARVGEDEFAAIAVDTAGQPDAGVIERLTRNLTEVNAVAQRHYKLALNFGTATFNPSQPCSVDELLHKARSSASQQSPEGRA